MNDGNARHRSVCGIVAIAGMLASNRSLAAAQTIVTIDPTQTYQTMTGFGASLTDSGASALSTLSPTAQSALMTSLFNSSSGAGLSFLRQPMGGSDFRVTDYTYDDITQGQTDYSLAHFSISHDTTAYAGTTTSIVSLLQLAEAQNPKLSLMGTPWTAPGWMKTGTATNIVSQTGVNQYLYGGTLSSNQQVINTYANYFVKYVQAYAAQGLKINFITPQNEPFTNGAYAYPSMTLTTAQQVSLITAIGQAFATNLVNPSLPYNASTNPYIAQQTKIEMLDHNWSDAVDSTGTVPSTNITGVLGSPAGTTPTIAPSTAAQYIDGVAFHGYGGSVSAQNVIHNAYPNMQVLFTEQSGSVETTGTVQQNFANDLMSDMQNLIVGGTRDWATTIVKFNLALDQNSGPKIETVTFNNGNGSYVTANSGDDTGRGVVTINSSNGAITYNEEYYALGQIAKFVQPGAVRIGSDSSQSVTFLNPDGTTAMVAYNNATTSEAYQFQEGSNAFAYTLPAQSVVTFTWSSLATSPVQVYETTGDMTQLLAKQASITASTTYQWTGASSSSMSGTSANYTPTGGTPGAADVIAFNASSYTNAPSVNASWAIGGLWFGSANTAGVTIAGSSTFSLNSTIVNGLANTGIEIDSGSGAVTITAPITLGASQTWINNSANLLTTSGRVKSNVITFTGTGTFMLSGTGDDSSLGAIVGRGATLILGKTSSSSVHALGSAGAGVYALTINNDGTAQLAGSGGDQIYNGSTDGGINDNGILDLNGQAETINNIGGSGTITNSSATKSTLTIGSTASKGSASTFAGNIADGHGVIALVVPAASLLLSGSNSYSGGTNVSAGMLTFASPGALPNFSGLMIGSGGIVSSALNTGTKNTLFASGLTIAGSTGMWSGKLDLNNNDMDVQSGSLANLTNQIAQGFNGGAWNGSNGIMSSAAASDTAHQHALAVIQNSVDGTTTSAVLYSPANSNAFDGATIAASTDVLVKYTYYGDANLDGQVDGSDYTRIDNGFHDHLTGWFNGDFNYDNVVDGSDYTLMDNVYNTEGTRISAQIAVDTAQIASSASVPEPATLSLLGLSTIGMLARRRRSSRARRSSTIYE